MSYEPRYQAPVLANDAIPVVQREALGQAEAHLKTALESLPVRDRAAVVDALRGVLAADRLSLEQRRALIEPWLAQLTALTASDEPVRHLRPVSAVSGGAE